MFDMRDPKTNKLISDGIGKVLQGFIDGCALLFAIMVLGLLSGLIYAIYLICTM